MTTEKFDQWCLLELFGHNKLAGRVSESTIAGGNFLRVDVPETKTNPSFTRIINPSAIYAINPITEEVARAYAENIQAKPIEAWDINRFMEKVQENKLLQAKSSDNGDDVVNQVAKEWGQPDY